MTSDNTKSYCVLSIEDCQRYRVRLSGHGTTLAFVATPRRERVCGTECFAIHVLAFKF